MIAALATLPLAGALAAWRFWPDAGLLNECRPLPVPAHLASHEMVQSAWTGLNASKVLDVHVHLLATSDDKGVGNERIWVNPAMRSPLHPFEFVHTRFYANAACANASEAATGNAYVARLGALQSARPAGAKLMLLAMDYFHDAAGQPVPAKTVFYVPDTYAADVAARNPARFEWTASIHPYRPDCLEALDWALRHGARAVKWLPSVMGIDPASPDCDRFYAALAKADLPLISHGGYEHPLLDSGSAQGLNNPLALRRALDRGVRVIVAHCASTGTGIDTDRGPNGPEIENFALFTRLMDEPQHHGRLAGDISAVVETSRVGPLLATLLQRTDWHGRLLNGSDYPLPGFIPEVSISRLVALKFLSDSQGRFLGELRHHDPLLFDFVLKRHLVAEGASFSPSVFETAGFFSRLPTAGAGTA